MKKINTLIYAVIALLIIVIAITFISKEKKADTIGEITIEVYNLDQSLIKSKEISFEIDDTLIKLIEENFDSVVFEESSFGPFLLGIEGYMTPDDFSLYISLYVNGEYSMVGIGQIELIDDLVVSLKIESYA